MVSLRRASHWRAEFSKASSELLGLSDLAVNALREISRGSREVGSWAWAAGFFCW